LRLPPPPLTPPPPVQVVGVGRHQVLQGADLLLRLIHLGVRPRQFQQPVAVERVQLPPQLEHLRGAGELIGIVVYFSQRLQNQRVRVVLVQRPLQKRPLLPGVRRPPRRHGQHVQRLAAVPLAVGHLLRPLPRRSPPPPPH